MNKEYGMMENVYLYVKDVTDNKVQYIPSDFGLRKASYSYIDGIFYGGKFEISAIINIIEILKYRKKEPEIISIINSVPRCPEMGEYDAVQEMKRIARLYGVQLKSSDYENALRELELYGFCRPDDYFECYARGRTVFYQFEEIKETYLCAGSLFDERRRTDIRGEYDKCCFCRRYKDPTYFNTFPEEVRCQRNCRKRKNYDPEPILIIRKARDEGVSVFEVMNLIEKN